LKANGRLLEVADLSIGYGDKTPTVRDVGFSINRGEVLVVIGESGTGKSTLANALLGILPHNAVVSSGSIRYKDTELLSCGTKEHTSLYTKLYGKEISAIFQNPGSYLNPIKKIKDQCIETIRSSRDVDKKEALCITTEMMEKTNLVNIDKILSSYPFELSGGMLQRVMIAMTFALEPALIIADEPTSALDVFSQKQVLDELIRLKSIQKSSMMIITHSFGVASYMADFIAVMDQGHIIEYGAKEEVLGSPKHPHTKELLSNISYIQKEAPDARSQ